MKKILVLMVLGLMTFNSAFGCTCPFDEVEELTCEVKYMICRDGNFDIEVCDNIKEKAKQFENDYTKACEECSEIAKPLREIEERIKHLEKDDKSESSRDLVYLYLERSDLQKKYFEASDTSFAIMNEFLGEEGNEIMRSESIVNKLFQLVDNIRK